MTSEGQKSKERSKNRLALIILYGLLPLAIVLGSCVIVVVHKYNFLCWNGTDTDHFPDGKKSLESNYRGGLLHGIQIQYYPSGLMMHERHYRKGKLHGLVRSWDAEGKIIEETAYANGQRHGASSCFDVSGKLSSEDTYSSGKRVKTVQYVRDPNQAQTVAFEGYYKNGRPDSGQFIRYSAAQERFLVYTYEKGKLVPPQPPPPDTE